MAPTKRHVSDWFEVEIDRPKRRVIVRRRAALFGSKQEAEIAAVPVLDVLSEIDRASHTLLFDAREARGVNDPEYEAWYAPLRRQIVQGFVRVAIVVRSASGRLHATRLSNVDKTDDAQLEVFDDLGRAERYLDAR